MVPKKISYFSLEHNKILDESDTKPRRLDLTSVEVVTREYEAGVYIFQNTIESAGGMAPVKKKLKKGF